MMPPPIRDSTLGVRSHTLIHEAVKFHPSNLKGSCVCSEANVEMAMPPPPTSSIEEIQITL